ncbi:HAMP domain-containing sensor histidine kinase [Pelomonas sp. UHG3]|uniref:HAMP domain-containing sensor histidine kinase n=1 Tax=Roseateles hydrophilus TaxID=2975054 RepID=A0ACC6CE84_9BURK|nr:HAMP domain-containing sensor histidine kinase [Pelomonas sp. UHG3]MCY4746682.1 HAMP domain-containing sensor histidine kinase [Pelomonas sp. UHG3]
MPEHAGGVSAWLRPLWRPTLLRRIVSALLLAFALTGVLLLGLNFLEFKREMAERPGALAVVQALAASLAGQPDARDARLIVQARAEELNHLRRQSGLALGDVELGISDAQGHAVYQTPGLNRVQAHSHWITRAQSGPWQLTLAEPRLADRQVLAWLGADLLPSLLVALPLVLLPVWIATHGGMRPLVQLANRIARRDAQDLAPLDFQPRHDELRTLVTAFDALLARLRAQLRRERAFVQDAAHELRTPLAVVATQAHLLAHAVDDASRQEAAAALQAAVQRSDQLSRQLLTLATLEDGKHAGSQTLDLAALVQEALATAADEALARGLELSLDAPASLPATLHREAFESVLTNLVNNALLYVPRGGHIVVTLAHRGDRIRLDVADDGPGIPREQREMAFDRFWRGEAARDVRGTGLGLAIVAQACRRLGGQVRLGDGLQGRGLGVTVELPT